MENIIRIMGYLIITALTTVLYVFLHSHYMFIALVVLIVAPFLSIAMGIYLSKKCSVSIEAMHARNDYSKQDEEAFFTVAVHNPTIFMSLDTKILLKFENTFFNTEGERVISVPVHPLKGYSLKLPVQATLAGNVKVRVVKYKIKDMMGFWYFKKTSDASAEVTVMPLEISDVYYDKMVLNQGALESEESSKRGNDFSDVQEIREYIPGDKLMSIHWKLSAKRDILMVKERLSMSDRQLVVLPELAGNNYELNGIIRITYSMIRKIIEDKTTVRLMYYSMTNSEYENIRIDYVEELDGAFAKMFYESRYEDMSKAADGMPMVFPELKSYLHVYALDNQVCSMIKENS